MTLPIMKSRQVVRHPLPWIARWVIAVDALTGEPVTAHARGYTRHDAFLSARDLQKGSPATTISVEFEPDWRWPDSRDRKPWVCSTDDGIHSEECDLRSQYHSALCGAPKWEPRPGFDHRVNRALMAFRDWCESQQVTTGDAARQWSEWYRTRPMGEIQAVSGLPADELWHMRSVVTRLANMARAVDASNKSK